MLRTTLRLSPSVLFPFFEHRDKYDYDKLNQPKPPTHKDGIERVKLMFRKDQYDDFSVELHNVIQASLCGVFFGACLGGFFKSRTAYIYFMESNEATAFQSAAHAKKKLQDTVTIAFAKGAVQWGWRLGLFTGCFSLITTAIGVYRDDTSLIDYIVAGTLTGAMYKANLGPAAMLVGAVLGGTLSCAGGLLILGLLKATGVTMEDIRKILYKIKQAREDQYNQALEKGADIKHDALTRHHDSLIYEKAKQKVEEMT